jgi:hypothetical protein
LDVVVSIAILVPDFVVGERTSGSEIEGLLRAGKNVYQFDYEDNLKVAHGAIGVLKYPPPLHFHRDVPQIGQ